MVPCASHFHIAEFFRLGLEHLDEFPPDDLALGLGIGDAGERAEKNGPRHRRGLPDSEVL